MLTAVANAAKEPLTFAERDVPEPGMGEVLVKMTACGVCNTDLGLREGHYDAIAEFPVVPGHEISGVVEALGPGVSFPPLGTRVGAQFLGDSDRHCDYCVRGDQILCPNKRVTGIMFDGGYSQYAVLKADFVTPWPDGLDPVAGAPLMCAGLTAFNGLRQGGITESSKVAVIGTGGIGGLAIKFAVAMGARVTAVARSTRSEAAMRELGVEGFIATEDTDPAEALKAWDGGADIILNSSPATSTASGAFVGLAPGGTLVLAGYDLEPLTLPTMPMVLNRLHALGNPSGSMHDSRDVLSFALRHGILPDTQQIGLRDANDQLDKMAKGHAGKRAVIVFE